MNDRGKIVNMVGYERGKNIDQSGWSAILPRHITPSDIDMIMTDSELTRNPTAFDNNGNVLLVEYSSKFCMWAGTSIGQRKLYQNLVKIGQGKIRAAIVKHRDVEIIDGMLDALAFEVMEWKDGDIVYSGKISGDEWPLYVQQFFAT